MRNYLDVMQEIFRKNMLKSFFAAMIRKSVIYEIGKSNWNITEGGTKIMFTKLKVWENVSGKIFFILQIICWAIESLIELIGYIVEMDHDNISSSQVMKIIKKTYSSVKWNNWKEVVRDGVLMYINRILFSCSINEWTFHCEENNMNENSE